MKTIAVLAFLLVLAGCASSYPPRPAEPVFQSPGDSPSGDSNGSSGDSTK